MFNPGNCLTFAVQVFGSGRQAAISLIEGSPVATTDNGPPVLSPLQAALKVINLQKNLPLAGKQS